MSGAGHDAPFSAKVDVVLHIARQQDAPAVRTLELKVRLRCVRNRYRQWQQQKNR